MKYLARCAGTGVLALLLFLPVASAGGYHGHHGHHSRVYVGVGFGGGWGYYPYYDPFWYGGPYYSSFYYGPPAYRVAAYHPSSGAVETDLRPKKALVSLDGTPMGQARDFSGPWDLMILRKGTHTLEFSAPGYMTLRVTLDVRNGGYYHIKDRLVEGDGMDPRSSPPAAAAEEAPAEGEFAVESDLQEEPAPAPPALQRGLLHLRVTPADAAVYLDGEFLAKGDELARLHGSIPVARGDALLEVLRPGYKQQTLAVTVDGDEPTRVRVDLEPEN